MPRKLLKRWSPDPSKLRKLASLKLLGKLLDDPNLFHLNRHSVSVAFFAGVFLSFVPIIPGQTFMAACAAFLLRCNLPITVMLIWITNPVTIPFIFYGTYKLGAWMIGDAHTPVPFEISWEWLQTVFPTIWQPLLLGSLTTGFVCGGLSYLLIQGLWRWHVSERWKARRHARKK